MIDLLGIINARDFHDSISEDIRVVNNNKYPFIEYQKEGGKEVNTINKIDPLLARASDLDYLLRLRSWNTPERKFIDGQGNLCIIDDNGTLDYIPTIYTTENEGEYKYNLEDIALSGIIINSIPPRTKELIDDVKFNSEILSISTLMESENDYSTKITSGYISPLDKIRKMVSRWRQIENEYRKQNNITDDTIYKIITRNKDKCSGGFIDIINSNSGAYTNIVNLNHYLEINGTDVDYSQKVLAKLGIKYSKKNQGIIDNYFKEISFFPFIFSYNSETQHREAVSDNFIREINNDVVIEYINGCVRIFPLHSRITECIINFCNLNYE